MRIEPIYEDAQITLYHGDCFEVLPALSRESVHLLLTDPPYGQEWQSNRRQQPLAILDGDDGTLDVSAALSLACRALRRGRHAYVFGPDGVLTDTPLTALVPLIWDKMLNGTGDLKSPYGLSHESITFAVYEPSKANREKGYGRLAARVRKGSVIRCQRPQGAATGRHPTEKPVGLLRELIESSSCIGETVLDPFAGSGSTLEAAIFEGRRAIGIEVNQAYAEVAVERIRALRTSDACKWFEVAA